MNIESKIDDIIKWVVDTNELHYMMYTEGHSEDTPDNRRLKNYSTTLQSRTCYLVKELKDIRNKIGIIK